MWYFEYNINLASKRKVNYKTCFLFNLNMLSKFAKIDGSELFNEHDVEKIIHEIDKKDEIESFTGELYNSKGQKIKYDSKTQKIIIIDSGYMITISKYLFLLDLILFLGKIIRTLKL